MADLVVCESKVPGYPSLVRLERKRGRAWPRCAARELLTDEGRHLPAPKYPWCDRPAPYLWGEQHLCQMHAEHLARDRVVSGITPNGRWGGCLVHIDCDHPIDDPDWETFYTVPRAARPKQPSARAQAPSTKAETI